MPSHPARRPLMNVLPPHETYVTIACPHCEHLREVCPARNGCPLPEELTVRPSLILGQQLVVDTGVEPTAMAGVTYYDLIKEDQSRTR